MIGSLTALAPPAGVALPGGVQPAVGGACSFSTIAAAHVLADPVEPAAADSVATSASEGEQPPEIQAQALLAMFGSLGARPDAPARARAADMIVNPDEKVAGDEHTGTDCAETGPDDGDADNAGISSTEQTGSAPALAVPAAGTTPDLASAMLATLVTPPAPPNPKPAVSQHGNLIAPAAPRVANVPSIQLATAVTDAPDDRTAPALPSLPAGGSFVLATPANAVTPVDSSMAGALASALPPDATITHHLDIAQDHVWLDQLAQDISRSADPNGRLRFALAPEHLGRMTVDLTAGADGTAVRLTTESEQARRIVSDAQPRLVAEAQAQGLRITETQVALDQRPGGQHRHDGTATDASGAGGGRPNGEGRPHQTFAEAHGRPAAKRQTAHPSAARHLYA
jgi:flagellar hook-length control protein FliK